MVGGIVGRPFLGRSSEELRVEAVKRTRRYQAKYPDRVKRSARKSAIKRKFGLTLEDFNEMLLAQECLCAICKIHVSKLKRDISVDHDHKTGKVRALLCYRCNTILGMAKDSIEVLKNTIAYLEKHNAIP